MKQITIKLPFPLITWNRLLAMNKWDRKKYRDMIHDAVSISIREGFDSLTPIQSQERLALMGWSFPKYYQTIRPARLPKLHTARRKYPAKWVKRKKR